MAYGKKPLKNRTINRNPFSRPSGDKPFDGAMRYIGNKMNPTNILTGRAAKQRKPVSRGVTQPNTMEQRGGARRAPFLSNTGPGKKKY